MLVSDYFSTAFSHGLPQTGVVRQRLIELRNFAEAVGVDEYCLSQAAVFKREFAGYRHLTDSEIRVYRYEDVVFEKRRWLADMLPYFEVAVPDTAIEGISAAHDVRPELENPNAHIRQVTPGNFRRHLNPATIDILNREFEAELTLHSYES